MTSSTLPCGGRRELPLDGGLRQFINFFGLALQPDAFTEFYLIRVEQFARDPAFRSERGLLGVYVTCGCIIAHLQRIGVDVLDLSVGSRLLGADPAALEQDEIELVVQVNGKLRGSIRVPKAADQAAIRELAISNANVKKFVEGLAIKKVVVVPGRLVNLVV